MRASDRWVVGLSLGYAAFLVFGSLVPLNWQAQPWGQAWQAFLAMPGPAWRSDERVDVAVNFLLMVPLAFGVTYSVRASSSMVFRLAALTLAWPLLAAFSVALEFTQIFFPPRDPSWTDVAAQWAGSAFGIAAYGLAGRRFRGLLEGLAGHHPARARSQRWLVIYLALLLAFSVMPLDLSLSPVELYRKWRDGRIILLPFGAAWPGAWQFVYDLATDIALWVPVGLLWRIDGWGRSLGAVVARGLLAAALVECAQLMVLSRVSDVTDVFLAGLGLALGALLPRAMRNWAAWTPQRQARWLAGAWCTWLAAVVLVMWAPFDFSLAHASRDQAQDAFTRMPFQTYFFRGEFHALNEIVRKLLVFLPGGLLMGAWSLRLRVAPSAAVPMMGMALLALGFELGQLFVPSKVADATDAALSMLGAWTGWRIARSLGPVGAGALTSLAMLPPPRPTSVARPAPPRHAAPRRGAQFLVLGALAVVLWLGSQLPGLPYNVAKLMPPGIGGALAAAGLAFALWWMLAAPLWFLAPHRARWRLAFPVLTVLHALVTMAVLYASVPLAMIHKIIGYPVLGWVGPWEEVGRYVALHCSAMFPVLGGALLVRTLQLPAAAADFVYWVCVMLVLFWPLHWVVVDQAGTDNLVELMRDGGSWVASAALGTGFLLLAVAGSAAGAALAPGRRLPMLMLGAAALALAPALFSAGLEPLLVKYGRAFSALQFIVSAGRDSYAVGPELQMRAALALGLAVLAVAALQASQWRALAAVDAAERARRYTAPGARPAA